MANPFTTSNFSKMTLGAQLEMPDPYSRARWLLATRPNPYLSGPRQSTRRRRRLLGALTAQQAVESVFPSSSITSTAGHTQSIYDGYIADVQAGQIVDAGAAAYEPGSSQCSATGVSSNVKLAQTASGLALTGTMIGIQAATGIAAAVLAPWTMGISTLIGLFPLIFGHHAQAVKKEQSVLCAAVPAANDYLQVIDQAVQSGQATPAQGQQALASLVTDFQSQVSSIIKGSTPASSGDCNAACVMVGALKSIVAYKTSVYQDMITSASNAPASSVLPSFGIAASSGSLAQWLPLLVLGFIVYELL